jgi:hypothetical protein
LRRSTPSGLRSRPSSAPDHGGVAQARHSRGEANGSTIYANCAASGATRRPARRTFLRNHTVWACDFLQTHDVGFVRSSRSNSPMPADVDSSSFCSLRTAITAIFSNLSTWHGCTEQINSSGSATIIMPPGTYALTNQLPPIASGFYTVTLQGSGYGQAIIDGAGVGGNFYGPISLNNVNVWDLTIQNFQPASANVNPYGASAVVNPEGSTSSLNYVVFLNNGPQTPTSDGTAIINYGTLYANNVDISSKWQAFAGLIYQGVDPMNSVYAGALYADDHPRFERRARDHSERRRLPAALEFHDGKQQRAQLGHRAQRGRAPTRHSGRQRRHLQQHDCLQRVVDRDGPQQYQRQRLRGHARFAYIRNREWRHGLQRNNDVLRVTMCSTRRPSVPP